MSQSQALSLKHISMQKMTFVANWCQRIAYLPYIKSLSLFTLQGWTLSIQTSGTCPTSSQLNRDSKPGSFSHSYYNRQNLTFVAKYWKFIAYVPYIKRLMLLYLLYKAGHSQPIPEEAIQSILNLFKSQNQLSSLNHICGQKMTNIAKL
jgi:hypothetical protein